MSDKDIIKKLVKKINPKIFLMYRSSMFKPENISSHATKFYWYFFVFIIFAVCGFGYFIKVRIMSKKGQVKKVETKIIQGSGIVKPQRVIIGRTTDKNIYRDESGKIHYEKR